MRTRRSVVASADPEGDLPQLEVGEEFIPFGGAELAVFFAGPFGSAAGDESPMVGDHVLGVDRLWRTQISQLSEWVLVLQSTCGLAARPCLKSGGVGPTSASTPLSRRSSFSHAGVSSDFGEAVARWSAFPLAYCWRSAERQA